MRVVGIEASRDELSERLRQAASGEIVLVTEGDLVVAEIHPPRSGGVLRAEDEVLADLVRKGQVQPALGKGGLPPRRPVARWADLERELDEDRASR
jgi:antitoxin (DNA-binding transcriptional repressor) of toxin-antitoxin stability system